MTDYFALLGQPRRPWIDLEKLEEKYHELARTTHPDQSTESNSEFADINKAYRALRDPKWRLEHLLALEGREISSATNDIPNDLIELFMQIAPALKSGDTRKISELLTRLDESHEDALQQLRALNEKWKSDSSILAETDHLHRRFSFLARWKDVMAEQRQVSEPH